ncbi:hypothetical protein HPB47_021606 [Ixodes persulcatus]|uniref:Uncharacterized protein n=1 Tax=Ixodes persulcatus TaxID=34615 RepID=A0AC60QC47_IXOPE|nr:hypothetical protein HPB47_021606 [Ixodes persulcatus]
MDHNGEEGPRTAVIARDLADLTSTARLTLGAQGGGLVLWDARVLVAQEKAAPVHAGGVVGRGSARSGAGHELGMLGYYWKSPSALFTRTGFPELDIGPIGVVPEKDEWKKL